jgi:integrase
MIEAISNNEKNQIRLVDLRDKAILLLGFAGAFRRSELVGINCEDLKLARDGVIITLNRSKTDQEEQGRNIAIPYGANPLTCPIRALQDWIHFSGIQQGPLFRKINRHRQLGKYALSAHSIALIIKRNAYLKEKASSFSGHSLRAGFATTAALAGVPEFSIMRQTGHKRSDTLKKYIRSRDLWKDNPASRVGL